MKPINSWREDDERSREHYDSLAQRERDEVRAVGWSSRERQELRFSVLVGGADLPGASILDVGCGNGALIAWLRRCGVAARFTGLDISGEMIEHCRRRFPDLQFVQGSVLDIDALFSQPFDYVFASGIFTYRQADPTGFFAAAAQQMFRAARRRASLNCLSAWGNKPPEVGEFRMDPLRAIEMCHAITPLVALRHDYHPGDFTIHLYRREP